MSEFSPIWGGNEGYGTGNDVKQSAIDLSRGKITFCVYRGISEKGAENQALVVGHLK